jgi:hypothetical protein
VTLSSLVFCSVFAAISRDCNYDALADSPSRKDSEINQKAANFWFAAPDFL